MKNQVGLAIGFLLSAACTESTSYARLQLQTRAALDFDFQADEISARAVDNGTVIARGCGKRAIYIRTCTDRYDAICVWMLNSPIRSADNPAP